MLSTYLLAALLLSQISSNSSVVKNEFVYDAAPFPSCHASTIVESSNGTLVCAWFGGTAEGQNDVGIWASRYIDGCWTAPVEAVNGVQTPQLRYPCWNPVLFQKKDGPLFLFFKVGPNPSDWWGEYLVSRDNGQTWTDRTRLPDGGIGPVKNKALELADGTILAPSSTEKDRIWLIYFERSEDGGQTWTKTPFLHTKEECEGIQPTVLQRKNGSLRMLARNKNGNVLTSSSGDGGKTWTPVAVSELPNPNSGIDAVTLKDGRSLLVYNPLKKGRNILDLALSEDGGISWKSVLTLEKEARGEFSYPAIVQTSDGLVHITYTWQRKRVRHVVVDPENL